MIRRVIACSGTLVRGMRGHLRLAAMTGHLPVYRLSTKAPGKPVDPLQQLKQQSKEFYSSQVQKIVQLKSSSEFQKLILSTKQPIILDLYADWCEPCKKLTPRLQAKVKSLDNVKLIKVNIDKCPEVAHALQVKSVPTVYMLYQGQAVDKIQGNVTDAELGKFFDNIAKITGVGVEHKEAVETLESAKKLMKEKKIKQAAEILQNFKQKKVTSDLIAIKQLLLTQCYLILEKPSKFKDSITRAGKYEQFLSQAPELNQFYQILKQEISKFEESSKQDPTIAQLAQKIASAGSKEDRLGAKFELLEYYRGKEMSESALETAMEIIKEDKEWQEKKTNKLVLAMFKELGNNSPLVQKYRKVLQRILS